MSFFFLLSYFTNEVVGCKFAVSSSIYMTLLRGCVWVCVGLWLGRGRGGFTEQALERRACEVTKVAAIFLPAFGKIDTACYSCLSSSSVAFAWTPRHSGKKPAKRLARVVLGDRAPEEDDPHHAKETQEKENMPAPSPPSPPQHHVLLLFTLDGPPCLAFVVACGTRTNRAHWS